MKKLLILLTLLLSNQTLWAQTQPTAEQIKLWQTQFQQLKWLETRLIVKANNIDAIFDRVVELTAQIRQKRDMPIAQQLVHEQDQQEDALANAKAEYRAMLENYSARREQLEKSCNCNLISETALPDWTGKEPLVSPKRLP